ncbi:Sarcosine dehydrogenase, mitochondrial [Lemmus lemmus]
MRKDPLHEELLGQGCVFQERHGWERPGWFNAQETAPVLDYDYYGAYGKQAHRNYAYSRLLGDENTFDFPPHHHAIREECLACRRAAACSTCLTLGSSTCWGWMPGRPLTGSSQQMSTDPQAQLCTHVC